MNRLVLKGAIVGVTLLVVLLLGPIGLCVYGCKSAGENLRVDEKKNKALETLSDWGAVMKLIEAKEYDKALELACLIQQAVKASDQNLCLDKVKGAKLVQISNLCRSLTTAYVQDGKTYDPAFKPDDGKTPFTACLNLMLTKL